MPPKSKVELSIHYNEIVDLLLAGNSGRYVSDYLLNEYNEKISYKALNTYKKNKLNVKAAAKRKIIEKEKKRLIKKNTKKAATREAKAELSMEAATSYLTRNYERAEKFIESTADIDIIQALEDYRKSPDFDEAKYLDMKIKVQKLRLEHMKYETDLLEDNTLNVNVNNEDELFDEAEIMRILNEESELQESNQ